MEHDKGQTLLTCRFGFIGKILATFSHELKNHLAIIKEHSGLIDDFIEIGKAPSRESGDLFRNSLRSIDSQVDKTLLLIRYLNRFSHRMDVPVTAFNVNDVLEELIALIGRLTNQRRVRIETDFQRDLPMVTGDPAMFQFVIFGIVEDDMRRLSGGGSMVLKTAGSGDSVTIHVMTEGVMTTWTEGQPLCPSEMMRMAASGQGWKVLSDVEGETLVTIPLTR